MPQTTRQQLHGIPTISSQFFRNLVYVCKQLTNGLNHYTFESAFFLPSPQLPPLKWVKHSGLCEPYQTKPLFYVNLPPPHKRKQHQPKYRFRTFPTTTTLIHICIYIYISIHFTSFLILTWVGNWDMEHQKTLKTWWPPHSHQAWSIFPSDFAALPVHRKSLNGALLQLGTRAPTKASSCQSCEDCSSHFVKVVCESAGDIWNRLDALNKYIWIRNDWKIVTQKSNTWSCP